MNDMIKAFEGIEVIEERNSQAIIKDRFEVIFAISNGSIDKAVDVEEAYEILGWSINLTNVHNEVVEWLGRNYEGEDCSIMIEWLANRHGVDTATMTKWFDAWYVNAWAEKVGC